MHISSYQVQHVLRVYTNQLKSQKLDAVKKMVASPLPQDEVTLSEEGKKKQLMGQVLSQVVGQLTTRAREQEHAEIAGDLPPEEERREAYGNPPHTSGRR